MDRSSKSKIISMFILIILTSIICIALLFNVQIYSVYAVWKTPVTTIKKEKIIAHRGNIYDCNGKLLAGTKSDGERYYPQNTAVHVLGAVTSSGVAQSGIELEYNDYLTGQDGEIVSEYTTCRGETSLTDQKTTPAQNGKDIYLTIDVEMQKKIENILDKAMKNYKEGVVYNDYAPPTGSAGAITIANTHTGEILAMASAPDYKLENFSQNYNKIIKSDNSPLLNRATQGLYRPGSTFKTITAFAALSEGAIDPKTYFFCKGEYYCEGTMFSCMKSHRFTNVSKALEVSCNIFFYKASQQLGIDNLVKYEKLFGLGKKPEFELPTYSGQLASPETYAEAGENWDTKQLIQAAIGQSKTACTPLQMAFQAQTIANRGVRYTPTIVSHINDETGKIVYRSYPKVAANIIDTKGAFETCIGGMITSTIYTYGDYAITSLPENTAIKTGTPQSPRGYDSAVIGFYPAYNPEISFSVMLEGGSNAKNTVKNIVDSFLESKENKRNND